MMTGDSFHSCQNLLLCLQTHSQLHFTVILLPNLFVHNLSHAEICLSTTTILLNDNLGQRGCCCCCCCCRHCRRHGRGRHDDFPYMRAFFCKTNIAEETKQTYVPSGGSLNHLFTNLRARARERESDPLLLAARGSAYNLHGYIHHHHVNVW